MVCNADLADALFQLAESHPPGDERVALLRAAYAVFDHARELAASRRLPEAVPLDVLPTVTMLRTARSRDALAAVVERLAGPLPRRDGHLREGFLSASEARAALAAAPDLDARRLRGAVHWHTRASDGVAPLDVMARSCARRGASWAVVADHTRGLECVNGLDAEGIALQRGAVAAWNRRHGEDLFLIQGLEAEILDDGRLDLPRDARVGVLLIAAVHTALTDRKDQTTRVIRALEEPGVWGLAHPQGRLFARRGGIRAQWDVVFEAAARHGIRLEINGFPRRQDLDESLLRLALAAGCRFFAGSDAHHPRHLGFDATSLALAARAGVPPSAVINFEPVHHLLDERPDLAPD